MGISEGWVELQRSALSGVAYLGIHMCAGVGRIEMNYEQMTFSWHPPKRGKREQTLELLVTPLLSLLSLREDKEYALIIRIRIT